MRRGRVEVRRRRFAALMEPDSSSLPASNLGIAGGSRAAHTGWVGDAAKFRPRLTQVGGVLALVGVLSVAAGMVLAPYDVAIAHQADPSSPDGSPWAGLVYLSGLLMITVGLGIMMASYVRGRRRRFPQSVAALKPIIETRPLPFTVCTECKIVIDLPHAFSCPECSSLHACVRVQEDAERSMAIAALG